LQVGIKPTLKKLRPQQRQAKYPDYSDLKADFEKVQKQAATSANKLYALVFLQASAAAKRAK
jgi:hypothetical protein